jgi:hypothetical protein
MTYHIRLTAIAHLLMYFSLAYLNAQGQKLQLTEAAQVSLWTVAPGTELYSTFGHSAVQVTDPVHRLNKVYNYGTFDFDTPNFYTKFMRGQLPYYLNIESYRQFEYSNMLEHRLMEQAVLNLDSLERQRLYDLLETNATEANKFYRYEFFYDNCATRIRDIIQEGAFHTLNWDSSHLRNDVTMRTLLHEHLTTLPWSEFGIDLVLGLPCDHRPTAEQYMFLPKYLGESVTKTKKKDGTPLVRSNSQVPLPPLRQFDQQDWFTRPFWVMSLIAIIGLLSMMHPTLRKIFDWIFWPTISLIGLLIIILWFFTEHTATKMNLNLLWALPTHLIFFAKSKRSEWANNYFAGIGMVCLILLLLWRWLPQQLPLAILPILILMVVKGFYRKYEANRR